MTEKQQKALAQAYLILESAFDHSLISVKDKEVGGIVVQPDAEVCWSGGWVAVKDLAEMTLTRVEYRKRLTRCPPNISAEVMKQIVEQQKGTQT